MHSEAMRRSGAFNRTGGDAMCRHKDKRRP
jgi:hypothetical protein